MNCSSNESALFHRPTVPQGATFEAYHQLDLTDLDGLIRSLFGAFDPDIRITAVEGKSFNFDDQMRGKLEGSGAVAHYCEVVEENAL